MSHEGTPSDWGVEHNPNGPWATIGNKSVQDALLGLASRNHSAYATTHREYGQLTKFLDICASAWLEQKAHVEEEAQKHGFIACEDTAALEESVRQQAALLCLTLKGSSLLLGNGCLSPVGGFGRYAKIPVRENESCHILQVPYGVCVAGDAVLYQRLHFDKFCDEFNGITNTSALQLLFYTTTTLSDDHQRIIGAMLDASVLRFNETLLGMSDQTNSIGIKIPDEILEPIEY